MIISSLVFNLFFRVSQGVAPKLCIYFPFNLSMPFSMKDFSFVSSFLSSYFLSLVSDFSSDLFSFGLSILLSTGSLSCFLLDFGAF